MVWPTYRATKSAIYYANTHFGNSHRKNTPANAFRHALWNWLIATECAKKVHAVDKVLNWTEKITDMHEKIMPGNELSIIMDLHNNAVGRVLFRNRDLGDPESGITAFLELTKTSRKVKTIEEINRVPTSEFVHLLDP